MKLFDKKTIWVLMMIFLGQSVVPEGIAQEIVQGSLDPVNLVNLIREATENNPDIRAAKANWQAVKKRIVQSWALPDPVIGMDVVGDETETRVGSQENRFILFQKVPFPWKLWKRRKAAKEAANAAHQEYLAVESDILTRLKQDFYNLYLVDASIEVIEEVHSLLKKFEGSAQARYANRSGSQRDVAKAQADVSMTLEQLFRASV